MAESYEQILIGVQDQRDPGQCGEKHGQHMARSVWVDIGNGMISGGIGGHLCGALLPQQRRMGNADLASLDEDFQGGL